jgi:pimeloyl-ACP methyl ester carboxylesterase
VIDQNRAMNVEAFAGTSAALRRYLTESPLPARLASLGTPVLVIFGTEDQRWRASAADDYLAVPGARVAYLPDVGHTPIIEAPAETAGHLLSFTAAFAG